MRIGILGGTGPAGSGLAARLASIGYDAVIGSRSKYRAMEAVDSLIERFPQLQDKLHFGDNVAAADCDIVVIATPWDSAATTAQEHAAALRGKIVVSMANALVRVGHEFQPLVPPRGSVAAHVQAAVPNCRVVAAFHHLPAKELGNLGEPIDSDVLICGDDAAAVEQISDIVSGIPGCRPLDAGELSNATAIEAFTAVLLQLNVRYKARVAPKLTGIKRDPRATAAPGGHTAPAAIADPEPMMRLYDTARRAVVPFEPPHHVLIYTCGITPYDATHLGHAATYLAYDVLQRRLIDDGHRVTCVRNVTDVDDPLFDKARELGVHYLDLAAGEEARFEADMEALNALPVAASPRASSAIPDIRGFIGMVIDRGYAYQAGGAVYFDVSRFASFGDLGHYSRADMLDLARQRGGDVDNPDKRDPLDFVLWQPSAPDEPSWDTLWGPGRPGWHIECSALALRELGSTIHLHGGGTDLIFPHHECERAQSEAATGEPFVQHWMHTALISMDGAKMSKSLGNLVFIDTLRKEWDPAAIRLGIIGHHYRTEWEWDDGLMERAAEQLQRWRVAAAGGGSGAGVLDVVRSRLDDDLDTPGAFGVIDEAAVAGAGEGVAAAAELLGIEL